MRCKRIDDLLDFGEALLILNENGRQSLIQSVYEETFNQNSYFLTNTTINNLVFKPYQLLHSKYLRALS